jgi:hypothetical protein
VRCTEHYGPLGKELNGRVIWLQIDVEAATKDVDNVIGAEE